MDADTLRQMELALDEIGPGGGRWLLDAGALDVNGCHRQVATDHDWRYAGLDIMAGRNVDVVVEPYRYPFRSGSAGAVISGATMEYVFAIWRWVPELARLLQPGGHLVLLVPHAWEEHRYPVDCWRVLPDGMRMMLEYAGLEVVRAEKHDDRFVTGIGRKR